MADRRRRKCLLSDVSDCGSDESGDERPVRKSSNPGSDAGNSEYESVEEEELAEEEEVLDEEEPELLNGPAEPQVREQDQKPLDHDEDRKNPQYIPKRGTFYEHDDRTMGEDEGPESGSEKAPPSEKDLKKKVWKEDGKWQHDRFAMYDQSPKSREELVATYGYDIRNEEGPPRARRRRRYGRGPNKYTRNWEDVDAYSKPTRGRVAVRGGQGRGRRKSFKSEEEFPLLSSRDEKEIEPQELLTVENLQIDPSKAPVVAVTAPNLSENMKSGSPSGRGFIEEKNKVELLGLGRGIRPSLRKGRPGTKGHQGSPSFIDGGQYPGRIRGENIRGRESKGRGSGRGGHTQSQTAQHLQKEVQEVADELKAITISASHKEEHHYKNKRGMDNRRNMIPPRLQETMKGNKSPNHAGADSNSVSKPKRYSSQRQRPLQDQVGQYHHSQGYFDQNSTESGYPNKIYERANSSTGSIPPTQLSLPGQAPPTFVAPSFTTTATTYPPGPRLFPPATQTHLIGPPSVPGPPIGAPPPVRGPPVPGSVGGPPVTGPPFLPPENMINYAAGAPTLVPPPHAQQFPAFQTFTPVSQQQPAEIYSNGVMYYNTQSQQHLPRINSVLQKRPKAAIPIVRPPDKRQASAYHLETEQQEEYDDLESAGECYDDACSDQYHDLAVEFDESPSAEVALEDAVLALAPQSDETESQSLSDQQSVGDEASPSEVVDATPSDGSEETTVAEVTVAEVPHSEDELSPDASQERTQIEMENTVETPCTDSRETPSPVCLDIDDISQNGQEKEPSSEVVSQEETEELETTTNLEESKEKSPSVTDLSKCKEITEPAAVTT